MRRGILLLGFLALGVGVGCQSQSTPKATLTIVKERHIADEPIGVRLTVSNPGPNPITVLVQYPTIGMIPATRYRNGDGIRFYTEDTGLQLRHDPEELPEIVNISYSGETISAGEEWSTVFFLQRFLRQPPPGTYCLRYDFHLSYWEEMPHVDDCIATPGVALPPNPGELCFSVRNAPPHELITILEEYRRKCFQGLSPKQEQEAAEALCVVETPAVIPSLVQMVAHPAHRSQGLAALSRFRGHPTARQTVVDQALSNDSEAAPQALEILAEWRHRLSPADLERLRKSDNLTLHTATLRYLDRIGPSPTPPN